MDHIVYLDARAGELEKILRGEKTMIIRGAAGRKMPHGRVFKDDILYFVDNNGDGMIRARGKVKSVFHSEKMEMEVSGKPVNEKQDKLQLSPQQIKSWADKRYLLLIEAQNIHEVEPFGFHRTSFSNINDWFPAGDIEKIKR